MDNEKKQVTYNSSITGETQVTFDIQQYRILTLFSSCFFDIIRSGSCKDEKCCASHGKSYFLCHWGAPVSAFADGFGAGKLCAWPASGAERKTEG